MRKMWPMWKRRSGHERTTSALESSIGLVSWKARRPVCCCAVAIIIRIQRILDETVDTARGPALASARLGKASIAGLRNDWAAAIQHNRKAIEILQPLPDERDRRLLGIAISNMAYAFCRLPDFARAEETCREGLDLANEMSDEWLEGKVAGLLALALLAYRQL